MTSLKHTQQRKYMETQTRLCNNSIGRSFRLTLKRY